MVAFVWCRYSARNGKQVIELHAAKISSGSRNLSGGWGGPDDSRNLWQGVEAIFLLTSFNRGRGAQASDPLDPLLKMHQNKWYYNRKLLYLGHH